MIRVQVLRKGMDSLKWVVFSLSVFGLTPTQAELENAGWENVVKGSFVCSMDFLVPGQLDQLSLTESQKEMIQTAGIERPQAELPDPQEETGFPPQRFHVASSGFGFELGIPEFFLPMNFTDEMASAPAPYLAVWSLQRNNLYPDTESIVDGMVEALKGSSFKYKMSAAATPSSSELLTLEAFNFSYERKVVEEGVLIKADRGERLFQKMEPAKISDSGQPIFYSTFRVSSFENLFTGEIQNEEISVEFHSLCVFQ